MKGDPKVIAVLQEALRAELTGISQYMLHSLILANKQYTVLATAIRKRAILEMEHAEHTMERLIFLEGLPVVNPLLEVNIGLNVVEMFAKDLQSEYDAVTQYNDAIAICTAAGDDISRLHFVQMLQSEEEHVDWLEAQMEQINEMGIGNYLTMQTK